MASFLISYGKTAKNEGSYTNDHDDNGNWTGGKINSGMLIGSNYGISAPVLMKYLGKIPSVFDMKNISMDLVQKIYREDYWNKMRGDEIRSQEVANSIYDSCVNMGCYTAIKLAQRAAGLFESGIMDDSTLSILNK